MGHYFLDILYQVWYEFCLDSDPVFSLWAVPGWNVDPDPQPGGAIGIIMNNGPTNFRSLQHFRGYYVEGKKKENTNFCWLKRGYIFFI